MEWPLYSLLEKLSDPVGLFGVVIILIAYLLLVLGKWSAHSVLFQFINFLGAIFILFSLYFHWNLSSIVIEIAWAVISLIGIFRILKKRPS